MKNMTAVDKMNWLVFGAFMTAIIVAAVYNSLTIGTQCSF